MAHTCVPFKPETWPDEQEFVRVFHERFPKARIAELVMHAVEWREVAGLDERTFLKDKNTEAVAEYYRMLFGFDGPLYLRYRLEFDAWPGEQFMKVEQRKFRWVPRQCKRMVLFGVDQEVQIEGHWEEVRD